MSAQNIRNVGIDDIYIGNGVSELIVMSMQGLLNDNDEMLIPARLPALDRAVSSPVATQYIISVTSSRTGTRTSTTFAARSPNTRGIVVINPNNPTGALYPESLLLEILELAREHKLIVFADEIYDKILYDGEQHTSLASLADDVLCITFNGLSKTYRAAGFRSGWMIISGLKHRARDLIEGFEMLSNMRLCANVPSQHAIQTALGGYQSINELIVPGGRLYEQRTLAWEMLNDIPGVSCVKPKGAIPVPETGPCTLPDSQRREVCA